MEDVITLGGVFSQNKRGGQIFVQPLMLSILQVKVLHQELPIYLGSHIRLEGGDES